MLITQYPKTLHEVGVGTGATAGALGRPFQVRAIKRARIIVIGENPGGATQVVALPRPCAGAQITLTRTDDAA